MANIGLELLMENLKQLICSDSPPLMDNPFLQDNQPQFQLLYQEIESLRTFVMVDKDRRLARRLRDVVNEAKYIVDLFLNNAFIRNNTNMTTCGAISTYQSPNFDSFVEEIKSIEKEFMDKKVQSQTEVLQPIRLTGNQKQLDAILIVGMGGLGLLVKGKKSTYMWGKVAERGFPEDCKIPVRRLIWLWVAEGFIHEDGEKLLEEVAEDYLMELTGKSLLIVAKKGSNSGVKVCRIHDILRQLCLRKAAEENFFQQISKSGYLSSSKFIPGQQRRLFADSRALSGVLSEISSGHSTPHIRLFLCFNKEWYFSLGVQRCFHPFLLLRVLDLLTIHTDILPLALELLMHLRHLALWSEVTKLPSSVCNLWNLQTLILKENYSSFMNTRKHSKDGKLKAYVNWNDPESMLKRIPNVRKLGCAVYEDQNDDAFPNFSLLDHLETLKVIQPEVLQAESMLSKEYISFPNATILRGIPEDSRGTPILEMIDIDKRNHSLVKSTTKIREQHHTMGNYELKINVIGFLTSIK
ncbi:disease resistance protein [Tanacetum coccineum]